MGFIKIFLSSILLINISCNSSSNDFLGDWIVSNPHLGAYWAAHRDFMSISKFGKSYMIEMHRWDEGNEMWEDDDKYVGILEDGHLMVFLGTLMGGFTKTPIIFDNSSGLLLFGKNKWKKKNKVK